MPGIDPSSPALETTGSFGSGSVTTAAFNPPAESLIAIGIVAAGAISGVSGGGLTWTVRAQRAPSGRAIEWWTAPNVSAQTGITVTVTTSGAATPNAWVAAKGYVLTDVDLDAPVGATGNGASTTNAAVVDGYTSTRPGSRGLIAALEGAGRGLPTSTDDEVGFDFNIDGLFATKAANTPAPATIVQFGLDAFGTSAADWQWAAIEVAPKPAALVRSPLIFNKAALVRAHYW